MLYALKMECQGAQEEPDGRPGGPGRGKGSKGYAMALQGPLDLLAFLMAHPWATWNSLKGASFKEKGVMLTTCIELFLFLNKDHVVSYRHASVKPPWTFMLICKLV